MIDKLRKIFREDQIYSTHKDIDCFAFDASLYTGSPVAVVRPESTDQIRDLLGLARRFDFSLTLRGSGTSKTGSATANDSVVVDMSYFNKVKVVNTKDKWIEVEPFVSVDKLNSILKNKGFYFPFESDNKVATLGGLVSTGYVSKYCFRYGKLEDYVLGMEYIDGTGKIFYVNENNSYKDILGSEGSLAIITKLRLKIVASVKKRSYGRYYFQSIKELLKKLDDIKKGEFSSRILSIYFVSKSVYVSNQRYSLFVEFDTTGISLDDEISKGNNFVLKTKSIVKKALGFVIDNTQKYPWNVLEVEKVDEELLKVESLLVSRKYIVVHDPKFSSEKYFDFIRLCEINAIPLTADLGNGIFYPRFNTNSSNLEHEMYSFVFENDGLVSGGHGIGLMKKEYLTEEEKDSFSEKKYKFDYDNLLNNDKVIDITRFELFKQKKGQTKKDALLKTNNLF